jgi:Asp/Glu/hydantoin racemase
MKIWYQTYNVGAHIDPQWRYYEDACKRYVPMVARLDSEFHFATADRRAPKMVLSPYIQYLHLGQIIDNAIEAERNGYDVFVLGGMRDLGYSELKDAVDIPVAFIGEATFHTASLMANKFAVINSDEAAMQPTAELVRKYGFQDRALPGVHLGHSHGDLVASFEREPKRLIGEITAAARQAIKQGADILVNEFAATSVFLAEHGIRHVDGVPVLDSQAAVMKVAEMLVDFRKLGMPKCGMHPLHHVSAEDKQNARRIYGVE